MKQNHGTNELFLSSLQFFPTFANVGWSKFASLFFIENGITPSQLAIISTVQAIAKLLGYPTYVIFHRINDFMHSIIYICFL